MGNDESTDFVRLEIEAALRHELPIVPVLVENARLPLAGDLPESISKLTDHHGIAVRPDPNFHDDTSKLIGRLEQLLGVSKRKSVAGEIDELPCQESDAAARNGMGSHENTEVQRLRKISDQLRQWLFAKRSPEPLLKIGPRLLRSCFPLSCFLQASGIRRFGTSTSKKLNVDFATSVNPCARARGLTEFN